MRKVLLLILCLLLLAGCEQIQDQIDRAVGEMDPETLDDAQDAFKKIGGNLEDMVNDLGLDPEETKERAEILARGEKWILLKVKYGSFNSNPLDDYYDGYRADCSGFVSYAWQLKDSSGKKVSPTTASLSNYAAEIELENIQPGDAINNQGGGKNGHVVMFVSWLDEEHTRFVAFEENGGYGRAVQTELTIAELPDGGFTIEEYEDAAPGPYVVHSPLFLYAGE